MGDAEAPGRELDAGRVMGESWERNRCWESHAGRESQAGQGKLGESCWESQAGRVMLGESWESHLALGES